MKKLLLGLLCCMAAGAFAQDTVKKSNTIGKFDEQYMVLKTDKKMKQGSYRLSTAGKLVAAGSYDKGKRTGVWNFYNNGQLEQQYDYSNNKLLVNNGNSNIVCDVENASTTDSIKAAVKVGGYEGFRFLVANTNFEDNISAEGHNSVKHILTLDENGAVKSWAATIKNDDGIKVVTQTINNIPDDIALFLPATVNGQKVACTLTFSSDVKGAGQQAATNDNGKANVRGQVGLGRRGRQ